MNYSFEIVFKNYDRTSPTLQDVRAIYVSGICVLAKNDKRGSLYISKYIKKIVGRFHHTAGSISSPALIPKKDKVTIKVKNFPRKPCFKLSQIQEKYLTHITIENIVEYGKV